ncbi:inosine triphosphate pyrophosphatase [Atractiella rhizophila]|nr:inosine triphosphate pyrophosphatase [Atractiella rhizophila]
MAEISFAPSKLVTSRLEITSLDLDLPELQGTIASIALAKVERAAEALLQETGKEATVGKVAVVTEDTALCFNAMGELPGPYIKWFLKSLGLNGLNSMLSGFDDKGAKAICTFGYCEIVDGTVSKPQMFQGSTDGKIVPPRGPPNFGWDPVFEAEETGKTYAEMASEEKNAISHRARALEKMIDFLSKQS